MILQLLQQGTLALEDPASAWLPELGIEETITLRHLLHHTSGIFNYSNTNFVLLGMVFEAASGTRLAEALHARIIDPLQLDVLVPGYDEIDGRFIRGWAMGMNGLEDVTGVVPPSAAWGDGNLISDAESIVLFLRALFAGDLLDAARTDAITFDRAATGEYPDEYYGLGIFVWETQELGPIYGHSGAILGYLADAFHVPELDSTIVAMVNSWEADPFAISGAALDETLR